MNELTNERMNEHMNELTSEQTKERANERANESALTSPVSTKHLYNVGPTSKTWGRRCTNVVQMLSFYKGDTVYVRLGTAGWRI